VILFYKHNFNKTVSLILLAGPWKSEMPYLVKQREISETEPIKIKEMMKVSVPHLSLTSITLFYRLFLALSWPVIFIWLK